MIINGMIYIVGSVIHLAYIIAEHGLVQVLETVTYTVDYRNNEYNLCDTHTHTHSLGKRNMSRMKRAK